MAVKGSAVGAILVAAAVGWAAPAAAELLDGSYTLTVVDGGGRFKVGQTLPRVLTSCGPDCTRMTIPTHPDAGVDLHRQGDTWTGVSPDGACVTTLQNEGLVGAIRCNDGGWVAFQLTRDG